MLGLLGSVLIAAWQSHKDKRVGSKIYYSWACIKCDSNPPTHTKQHALDMTSSIEDEPGRIQNSHQNPLPAPTLNTVETVDEPPSNLPGHYGTWLVLYMVSMVTIVDCHHPNQKLVSFC